MPNSLLHRCSPPQQVRAAGELGDEVPNLGAILLELPKTISRLLTVPPPKKSIHQQRAAKISSLPMWEHFVSCDRNQCIFMHLCKANTCMYCRRT